MKLIFEFRWGIFSLPSMDQSPFGFRWAPEYVVILHETSCSNPGWISSCFLLQTSKENSPLQRSSWSPEPNIEVVCSTKNSNFLTKNFFYLCAYIKTPILPRSPMQNRPVATEIYVNFTYISKNFYKHLPKIGRSM